MVRDQNTPTPSKLFFIVTIASTLAIIAMIIFYLSLRYDSFAKTQPYHVVVKLDSGSSKRLIAEYDYGYGYNAGHQQVFELTSNQPQTVEFSISAWKKLNSLRLNSDDAASLSSLVISKHGVEYETLKSTVVVSKESPLELNQITHTLSGLKD